MKAKTRQPWNEPRVLRREEGRDVWYYVNRGSVTLCIQAPSSVRTATITRRALARMLADVNARYPK